MAKFRCVDEAVKGLLMWSCCFFCCQTSIHVKLPHSCQIASIHVKYCPFDVRKPMAEQKRIRQRAACMQNPRVREPIIDFGLYISQPDCSRTAIVFSRGVREVQKTRRRGSGTSRFVRHIPPYVNPGVLFLAVNHLPVGKNQSGSDLPTWSESQLIVQGKS